jgi:uracil-DNA glycosylase family 4
MPREASLNPAELLQWYADVGVDEAIGEEALDRLRIVEKAVQSSPSVIPIAQILPPSLAAPAAPPPVPGAIEALAEAKALAAAAKTLDELKAAIEGFNGLGIKRTASNIVFADGTPSAKVMLVGEAPTAEEDRAGRPFAGVNGQLLDKMLAAIGLSRDSNAYLTGVVNWYPPGGRAPSDSEVMLSLPFVQRHIELVNPAVLVLVGGLASKVLLESAQSIMRLRGKWHVYGGKTPAMALFHPSYLIGSPAQKGLAWQDLLMLKTKLKELGVL